MNQQREIDKTMVARAVVSKIQDESKPEQIRAKYIKEFEVPGKVTIKGSDGGYAPDIAAEFPRVTDVYQIELDDEMPVDKWRLFSLYARKKHGNFYLVVPDFLKENIKQQLIKADINAGLIYFDTK